MRRVAVILALLALTGCSTLRPEQTKSVLAGAEVTLAVGEAVTVKGSTVKIRFVGVSEDSRCPRDVNCIWAGEAKVRLDIHVRTQTRVEIPEGGSTVAGPYRVTLLRLEPQPVSNARTAAKDYRATLKIDSAS
jgi:hypothetical protein